MFCCIPIGKLAGRPSPALACIIASDITNIRIEIHHVRIMQDFYPALVALSTGGNGFFQAERFNV